MSTFNESKCNYTTLLTDCHLEALKKELHLRERIVIFIQQTDLWELVKQVCVRFHERFVRGNNEQDLLLGPLVVPLEFSYNALRKFDEQVLSQLIREPTYCEKAFREVILSIANTIFTRLEPPFRIRLEQIYCRLRIKLPPQERYLFRTQPQNVPIGLTVFRCVVQGYSSPQTYILQSIWLCPNDPHLVTITGEIRRAPKCDECGTTLQEHQRIRSVSDYCTVRVFSVESLQTPVQVGRIFQSISVRLADDLCQQLRLGYEYAITGVFNPVNQLFNAWAVEEI
ncbi:uncharacterized protein LOC131676174 [Topomyia yanbarensis]|uniref:uncharacterized protein LOC131676174 n=1 Tax=Topomyia yanbarensis TaxID=2498891 RepID=UPI00273C70AD|nr:uncharacterized protein LOC131676174 [Topomyia yanbarensis]